MNKEIKAEWVKRLRDGRKQGKRYLEVQHSDGSKSQCCLGVLCEIAKEQGVVKKAIVVDGFEDGPNYVEYDYHAGILPAHVAAWAGLSASDPAVWMAQGKQNLTLLNDNGTSFEDIADLIEEHL